MAPLRAQVLHKAKGFQTDLLQELFQVLLPPSQGFPAYYPVLFPGVCPDSRSQMV